MQRGQAVVVIPHSLPGPFSIAIWPLAQSKESDPMLDVEDLCSTAVVINIDPSQGASIPVCAADRSTLLQHLYEKTIYAVPPSTGSIIMKAAVRTTIPGTQRPFRAITRFGTCWWGRFITPFVVGPGGDSDSPLS